MEESREIAERIPHDGLHIFKHSGHSPHVEELDAFMKRVQRFLSALPR